MVSEDYTFEGEYAVLKVNRFVCRSLIEYVLYHRPVGSFLESFISNNLLEAACRADDDMIQCFRPLAKWFYNEAPSDCHGSPEKYAAWVKVWHDRVAAERII